METQQPTSELSETDSLLAVYDFQANPINFDFINFLVCAEMERISRGLKILKIMFVPGEPDYFFGSYGFDENQKHWRVQNILFPACYLFPSCQHVTLSANRNEARRIMLEATHVFPNNATIDQPVDLYSIAEVTVALAKGRDLPSLQAPAEALNLVSSWIDAHAKGRKVVTMTLRQVTYDQTRNSNIDAWAAFARTMDTEQYFPVFIPDTDAVFQPADERLAGLTIFDAAAINLHLRAALYELAYLNFMNGGGPSYLCKYDQKVRFLYFIQAYEDSMDATAGNLLGVLGIQLGGQFTFLTDYQKYIWQQETEDAINREFERFVAFDRGEIAQSDYYPAVVTAPLTIADNMAKFKLNAQAKEIYEYLLSADPNNTDLKLKIGAQEILRGHPKLALNWLEPLVSQVEMSTTLGETLGDAYSELKQNKQAIESYHNAIQNGAEENILIGIVIKLGLVLSEEGQINKANEIAEDALKKVSNGVLLLRFLSEMADQEERPDLVRDYHNRELRDCEEMLKATPEDHVLRLRIGRLEHLLNNFDAALTHFEDLLEDGFSRWDLFDYLGDTHQSLQNIEAATANFDKAIELTWRRRAVPLLKMATINFERGQLAEAVTYALDCLALAPDHLPTLLLLSETYSQQGNMSEAMRYMIMAREIDLMAAN